MTKKRKKKVFYLLFYTVNTLLNESVEQKSVEDKKTMDAMGRITIPKTFRKILGIENSTADFLIMLKGKDIILRLKD